MSQAASFALVYQQEEQIEAALSAMFTTDSVTNYVTRATDNKATPYVDIQVSLGAETGRKDADNAGTWRSASWEFELLVRVVTDREDDTVDHKTFKGEVRKLLDDYVAQFTELALPYHAIADLKHEQTQIGVDEKDSLDLSIMQFAGVVSTRADAWPA
jgi:hypothetical protein